MSEVTIAYNCISRTVATGDGLSPYTLHLLCVTKPCVQQKRTHTHTRLMALCSGTTRLSWYQKGKTNLDFTEARDSEETNEENSLDKVYWNVAFKTMVHDISWSQCQSVHPFVTLM